MIDRPTLLASLKKFLPRLEEDLRLRAELPENEEGLRAHYAEAVKNKRTAEPYEKWRANYVTQVAVAWIMSTTFVRFIEDNDRIDVPLIAGPIDPARGNRRKRADDEYQLYFREFPTHSDRDWFYHVFGQIQAIPAAADLFRKRNPVWTLGPSGDMAEALRAFWRKLDDTTGMLLWDFSGHVGDTRFLGDLYQDLSEDARKRYALLQTPEFVEEFILGKTLTPAIEEFGLEGLRLIDPTCGSGHFLLGAFHRLLEAWRREAPGLPERELVRRALTSVHGVDLNPFAVAIARFRLLEAALTATGLGRLKEAPVWPLNVTVADSLIHGRQWRRIYTGEDTQAQLTFAEQHAGFERGRFAVEDADDVNTILGQPFHVVVGNPPYITVKDPGPRKVYRERYMSAAGKYSLGVPFTERFFDLAIHRSTPEGLKAGFVGLITANSFMKREFGSKLIEEVIPHLDLSHVIDTSGAYIPGHGTPTLILFGRNRDPVSSTVRAALGIKGEPSTPEDPAQAYVWRSIVEHLDAAGFENEFVSIVDMSRDILHKHPWSLGGGGAGELKEQLEEIAEIRLEGTVDSIGITSFTLEDDVYLLPGEAARRHGLEDADVRQMVIGDIVRDWRVARSDVAVFPYDKNYDPVTMASIARSTHDEETSSTVPLFRYLTPYRTNLSNSLMFGGKTKVEAGLK